MNPYARFASAVVQSAANGQGTRFGQAIELDWYMSDLNAKIVVFDTWAFDVQGTPAAGSLPDSYFHGWSTFASAVPPSPRRTRPNGWYAFYEEMLPTPGAEPNPALYAMVESYEREFVRYYDMAVAGGADPPAVRPQPVPLSPPPGPGPEPEPGTGPGAPSPTPLAQSTGFGVGVLFMLAGAALFIASKTK